MLDFSVSANDESSLRDRVRVYDAVLARIGALPGVATVGAVNTFPLAGGFRTNGTFIVLNRPDEKLDMQQLSKLVQDRSRTGDAEYRVASVGYFRAMNIPVISGRVFEDRDGPDAPHVGVISQSLARQK